MWLKPKKFSGQVYFYIFAAAQTGVKLGFVAEFVFSVEKQY